MTKLNKFKQFAAANLIGCVAGGLLFGDYYLALGIFLYNVTLIAVVIHSEGNV
jgi:hypothetical protein